MRRLRPGDARWLLLGLLALAAAVQASRVPMRWGPVAIAYGAYVAEWRHAVATGGGWLTTWVGLHPPLFAALFAGALKVGVPPAGWLAASGAASLSAVVTVAATVRLALGPRGQAAALLAGAFVALSPHRVAYGLEVNNYPLLVGLLGAQGLAFAFWVRRGRAAPLLVTSALLPWAHLLGATALLGQLLAAAAVDRPRLRRLAPLYALAAVPMLPLVPGFLAAVGDPINDGAGWSGALRALLLDLPGRYGLGAAGFGVAALAALGAVSSWRSGDRLIPVALAAHAAAGTAAVLGAMASAQASDVQLQYWLVPLLPTCALAGIAIAGREQDQRLALVAAAILLGNGAALALDAVDARWGWSNADRSHPIATRAVRDQGPGDVLLLIELPTTGDDDKGAVDPIWSAVPLLRPLDYTDPGIDGLTPADPYWGQPVRSRDGRWLYTFATANVARLKTVAAAHAGRGERVVVAGAGLARHPTAGAELAAWAREDGATAARSQDEIAFVIPGAAEAPGQGLSPADRPAPDGGASPPR